MNIRLGRSDERRWKGTNFFMTVGSTLEKGRTVDRRDWKKHERRVDMTGKWRRIDATEDYSGQTAKFSATRYIVSGRTAHLRYGWVSLVANGGIALTKILRW